MESVFRRSSPLPCRPSHAVGRNDLVELGVRWRMAGRTGTACVHER